MCDMMPRLQCENCPFVSCNGNPRFYLALQCAARRNKADKAGRRAAARR